MLSFLFQYVVFGFFLSSALMLWHKYRITKFYVDFCNDSKIGRLSMDDPKERGMIIAFWIGVMLVMTLLWPVTVPMLLFEE